MSDKLDFLQDQDAPETTPTVDVAPTPPQQEAAQAAPAQAAAETPPTGDDKARTTPRDPQNGKFVPPGLLEERRKRQEAEAELERLRRIYAEQQQQTQPAYEDDPVEFVQRFAEEQRFALLNERLEISETLAREKFGNEAVDAATVAFQDAAAKNPALGLELHRHKHPYAYVLDWHRKHQLISEIGDDPETWRKQQEERIRAEVLKSLGQSPAGTTATATPQPPPSLVAAPSSATRQSGPIGPGSAFSSVFGD